MRRTPPLYLRLADLGLVAAFAALVAAGCGPAGSPGTMEVGLRGVVGLEFGPPGDTDEPSLVPVAVWLAPNEAALAARGGLTRPLAGARIETRVGGILIGSTATDAAGAWQLPRRPEQGVAMTVLTPTGLFGALAPAPVVSGVLVGLPDRGALEWPQTPMRVTQEEILGGISIIIEEAGGHV